jgi:hypothetical protein
MARGNRFIRNIPSWFFGRGGLDGLHSTTTRGLAVAACPDSQFEPEALAVMSNLSVDN